jgi:hypothetical protein
MRADRPLLLAVLFLAAGLGLIFAYCQGNTSMSLAFPFSASVLQIAATTYGPAAVGGVFLTAFGILLLLWAFLMAIIGEIALLSPGRRSIRRRERVLEEDVEDEPVAPERIYPHKTLI